jgi:hypothetical protein
MEIVGHRIRFFQVAIQFIRGVLLFQADISWNLDSTGGQSAAGAGFDLDWAFEWTCSVHARKGCIVSLDPFGVTGIRLALKRIFAHRDSVNAFRIHPTIEPLHKERPQRR